ncbi:MAG: transcriptional regulator PpsR [Gammaproteobacteria bacterium]|nr:transcriptional regulator PpsR [Gammaproteobacteria bacterium]
MNGFQNPEKLRKLLQADKALEAISLAADLVLLVDAQDTIRDVACSLEEPLATTAQAWADSSLMDLVTVESREKLGELLRDIRAGQPPRPRQLNHRLGSEPDLPVVYTGVALKSAGSVLLLGQELRAIADIQQRLIAAQQTMERDYDRLRHVETRYRLLFDMYTEPLLVVDVTDRSIVEANRAAIEVLGAPVAASFPVGLDDAGNHAVKDLLDRVKVLGRTEQVLVHLQSLVGGAVGPRYSVSATLLRHEDCARFLVRMLPAANGAGHPVSEDSGIRADDMLQLGPDGFVITDMDGRIRRTNDAFLSMVGLATPAQALGESLDRWLGRPGIDFNLIAATLKEHGSVRMFSSFLRVENDGREDIELSATAVLQTKSPYLGFIIRNVGRRLMPQSAPAGMIPHTTDDLRDLVGRMPLKELVRETTEIIERLCIEAALELTNDNRASAAEMLGLSRQSLYVKLRRFGMSDVDTVE